MVKLKLIFFILLLSYSEVEAQQLINIKGKVTDAIDRRINIPGCIVVNMRTQKGILANEDGTFSLDVLSSDTLAFRTIGYELRFVTLKDSLIGSEFKLNIALRRLSYQLEEVTIIPHRTLDSISKDINKLGYNEAEYILQGVDALQSPVTYLYQMFSRNERSKREVAFMMNEDQRKKLIRELLEYYVKAGYLPIRDRDIESFIEYCSINEAQLKTLTQYEMAVYVKKKYENFLSFKR
jgi:hypothetical protein